MAAAAAAAAGGGGGDECGQVSREVREVALNGHQVPTTTVGSSLPEGHTAIGLQVGGNGPATQTQVGASSGCGVEGFM